MLPAPCRWIDSPEESYLHWHYACIAVVTSDGALRITWFTEIHGQAASREQGKRYVERWVIARGDIPPGKRARTQREDMIARGVWRGR